MKLVALLLLLAWPLLEIGLMIKAAQALGSGWAVFAIIVGTALLGGAVLTRYGLATALKVQEAVMRGEAPLHSMLDGAIVATAGVLLMTPGLFADAVGLILLIPLVRGWIAGALLKRMLGLSVVPGDPPGARGEDRRPRPGPDAGPRADGPVIDGEFERLGERTIDPNRQRERGSSS